MMQRTNGKRERGGFTLIELLVVIAIIAILASLMLPALSKAKRKVRLLQCMNNVRNLGMSLQLYAVDHNDAVPDTWTSGNAGSLEFRVTGGNGPWNRMWLLVDVFRRYGVESNMFCPASTRTMVLQTEHNAMVGATGFRSLTGPVPYASGVIHSARIHPTNVVYRMIPQQVETPEGPVMQSASELVLFADNIPSRGENTKEFVPLGKLANPAGLKASHEDAAGIPTGGNAIYLDGHSSFTPLRRVRLWTVDNDPGNPCFWY
jgi:prepilin-type N-terminal cleavage/methylation domain-containing protein